MIAQLSYIVVVSHVDPRSYKNRAFSVARPEVIRGNKTCDYFFRFILRFFVCSLWTVAFVVLDLATSGSCGINRHTVQYTRPICLVSQHALVTGRGLNKPIGAALLARMAQEEFCVISYTAVIKPI